MTEKTYRILGKLVDGKTRAGIPNLRVEAWDKDLICPDLLGSAVTDGQGNFEIPFKESYFQELFLDRRPDIFFKIFRQNELILTTENTVLWNVEKREIPLVIEGDFPMEQPKPAPFIVRGQIRKADGSPLAGATVRAFDKDLRHEKLLGEQATNAEGRYEIAYTADQLRRPEKKKADLIVRVFDSRGELIIASPMAFKAGTIHIFDHVMPSPPVPPLSDFEKLRSGLASALEDISPADLSPDDVAFLIGATGISKERLTRLKEADRLGRQTGLPAEVFFALANRGLPAFDLKKLLVQPLPRLREELQNALKNNTIPAAFEQKLEEITANLKRLIVERAMAPTDESGKPTIGALLGTSQLPKKQQEALVGLLAEQPGRNQDFWSLLKEDPSFGNLGGTAVEEAIDEARFTLELGFITQNHLPLVQALQKWRQESLRQGKRGALKDLAALSVEDWSQLIAPPNGPAVETPQDVAGKDDAAKTHAYAVMLFRRFEAAFPSIALIAQIARSDIPARDDLTTFFKFHPDFDFTTVRIEALFRKLDEKALSGLQDVESTKQTLKTYQRLFRLSPRFDHIQTLLDSGFPSAASIAAVEPETWVEQNVIKFEDADTTRKIHKNASARSGSALSIWSTYSKAVNNTPIAVVPDPPSDPSVDIPNWRELFGSLDMCACRHCRSVYGPAAYLVDCLHFLSNAHAKDSPRKLLDVLFDEKRRPDIQYIDLSCDNTNTLMPYVDLVNEILERAVAAQTALGDYSPATWPQTTWTADELAANPEHVERDAYFPLSTAIFPWNLPFDHEATEARIYLKHLGTSRHELMEVFYNTAPDPFMSLLDEQIAREYLGMPTQEWKLLIGEKEYEPWELWGLKDTGNEIITPEHPKENPLILTWEEVLARCPEFLKRSGLTLDELIDLVELRFINPNKEIEVKHLETCKSEDVSIQFGNDWDAPRRICFFVRLLRRLNWSMWELDQALAVFGSPQRWRQFLVIVSQIQRLREKLGLSVMELLTWWGDLSTTPISEKGQSKPSFYERIFLNKTIIDPKDTENFHLNSKGEIQVSTGPSAKKITDCLTHITAALRASAEEILLILKELGDDDILTLSNLSYLYRTLSFCRAARLPVPDFIAFRRIAGIDPFAVWVKAAATHPAPPAPPPVVTQHPSSTSCRDWAIDDLTVEGVLSASLKEGMTKISNNPAYTQAVAPHMQVPPGIGFTAVAPFPWSALLFLTKLDRLRATQFRISELDYLLRHNLESPEARETALQQDALVLEQLRVGLQKIAAENVVAPDAKGDLLRSKLTLLGWPSQRIEKVIRTFNETEAYREDFKASPALIELLNKRQSRLARPALSELLQHIKELQTRQELLQRIAKIAIAYDEKNSQLVFTGAMTLAEKDDLVALLPNDKEYQQAIENLFMAPRNFVTQWMKTFEWPTFAWTLKELPSGISFPPALKDKISHDAPAGELRYIGAMEENERTQLLALSDDKLFQRAIAGLFEQAVTLAPAGKNVFLTQKDTARLFDRRYTERPKITVVLPSGPIPIVIGAVYQDPAGRFAHALAKLNQYLRTIQSESFVKMHLAQTLGLEPAVADPLLTKWLTVGASAPPVSALVVFLDESLAGSQTLVREKFSELATLRDKLLIRQFSTLVRLRKCATVLNKFGLGYKEARLLMERVDIGNKSGWLDIRDLPIEPETNADATRKLYEGWEKLADVCLLRDRMGTVEPTLFDFFELAASGNLQLVATEKDTDPHPPTLQARMGWDKDDLPRLDEHFKFKLTDYQSERPYLRLETCFRLGRRLGVAITKPANMLEWVEVPSMVFAADAMSIKQTVKAKYDHERWLAIAKPLSDQLREQKRQALVSFLCGLWGWDEDTLYEHFLIDVQMSPCMMTSRIKQAISSVQLFMQRCLLGLEKDVLIAPGSARQWQEWRSRYRIWEANRKVFLYPENWIEPDLRDDKSPFFRELENELRQSEITDESVETAFLHYLEKLDKVSHLEIVGQYYDEDAKLLHIFGRTKNHPHEYYYRNRDEYMVWTAWEKVNVDIEGDQLIPVVWNRRLYIFFPFFKERLDTGTIPLSDKNSQARKYWNIQIAWTEYKTCLVNEINPKYSNGSWTPKAVSPSILQPKHWDILARKFRPIPVTTNIFSGDTNQRYFYFRTRLYDQTNTLHVDCNYLRTDQPLALKVARSTVTVARQETSKLKEKYSGHVFYSGAGFLDYILTYLDVCAELYEKFESNLDSPEGRISLQDEFVNFDPELHTKLSQIKGDMVWHYEHFKNNWPNNSDIDHTFHGDFEMLWTQYLSPATTAMDEVSESFCGFSLKDYEQFFVFRGCLSASIDEMPKFLPSLSCFDELCSQENTTLRCVEIPQHPITISFRMDDSDFSRNINFWQSRGSYSLVFASQDETPGWLPVFFHDTSRCLQLTPNPPSYIGKNFLIDNPEVYLTYKVECMHHPYVPRFIKELNRYGINGLLSPEPDNELYRQQNRQNLFEGVNAAYSSLNRNLILEIEEENVTFRCDSAYGLYNWELFFHAPLMIADRLSKNQRFGEAKKWFEYIFDHTNPWLPGNILRTLRSNCVGEDVKRWQVFLIQQGFLDDQQDDGIFGPKTETATKEFQTFRGLDTDGIVGSKTLDEAILMGLLVEKIWQRPWKVRPFFENGDAQITIDELMKGLKGDAETQRAIQAWEDDPFNPHLIARLRMVAYQKNVVMKYLDNLIAWADSLFRQDTIESINEAVQLYILAGKILGPRFKQLPEQKPKTLCYADIEKLKPDEFSNVLVAIENEISEAPQIGSWAGMLGSFMASGASFLDPDRWSTLFDLFAPFLIGLSAAEKTPYSVETQATDMHPLALVSDVKSVSEYGQGSGGQEEAKQAMAEAKQTQIDKQPDKQRGKIAVAVAPFQTLYFCIPQNDQLLAYWDTLEDRLFKIRHCQNIEGQVRELVLFEPPIEPGLLVKAKAAGVDFSTILNDLSAPSPHYRFTVLTQKATELCQEVKALGAALLVALEKRDAEELALLRSGHEIQMLELVKEVRKQQIAEATNTLESLKNSKELSELKLNYYTDLISKGQIDEEIQHLSKLDGVKNEEGNAANSDSSARDWGWAPDISLGVSWNWTGGGGAGSSISTTTGGLYGVRYFTNAAAEKRSIALSYSREAEKLAIQANYKRRVEEWTLQLQLAKQESKQIDKQIAAAEIRVEIANIELANHEKQMENAKVVDDHMRSKFTNQDLYDWMIGQISTVYFQSYQLAYDTAKRAERCFRFELGLEDSDFIRYGYWDSLRQGLLAAEQLTHDLKRMELAYLEQNKREYELSKHVSLVMLDPIALAELKETGECYVSLPEWLFDLDCPGHYLRRFKNVSLTIPCITGPYASVNCTLTLLKHRIRKSANAAGTYGREQNEEGLEDSCFVDSRGAIQSIVTSSAQNDSGLFEPNLRDERYLPFEGTGVISDWRLQLPKEFRQFDYGTITDVIMHVRYTAREGGEQLKQAAIESARSQLASQDDNSPLVRLFSAKHEFSSQWFGFLQADTSSGTERTLKIRIDKNRFGYLFYEQKITINKVDVFLAFNKTPSSVPNNFDLGYSTDDILNPTVILNTEFEPSDKFSPWPSSETDGNKALIWQATKQLQITLELENDFIWIIINTTLPDPASLQDIWLAFSYSIETLEKIESSSST